MNNQNTTVNTITPVENISIIMKKVDLIGSHCVEDNLNNIIRGHRMASITTDEKNQLLMNIITNQIKDEKGFLSGIKLSGWGGWSESCSMCRGLGFTTIVERKIEVTPCPGNKKKNALPCGGSGIKTSPCVRCGGLTLKDILSIRELVVNGKNVPETVKNNYGHFVNIKVNKISPDFIEKNSDKTFRVIEASTDGSSDDKIYYYIPKEPCRSCKGTGSFLHDRNGVKCRMCEGRGCERCDNSGKISRSPIKCPGCGGKGHINKKLVPTGRVKKFIECSHCGGKGQEIPNPAMNLNIMDSAVRKALLENGLLKS